MSNESYTKDFAGWHILKPKINEVRPPLFKERDIWWCSIGVNIGHEEDGKNEKYDRPVLVIKKFNNFIFWGVPLTTQVKDVHYYYKINFNGKDQCVMVAQMRVFDSKRLTYKMGQLPLHSFEEIKTFIKDML